MKGKEKKKRNSKTAAFAGTERVSTAHAQWELSPAHPLHGNQTSNMADVETTPSVPEVQKKEVDPVIQEINQRFGFL